MHPHRPRWWERAPCVSRPSQPCPDPVPTSRTAWLCGLSQPHEKEVGMVGTNSPSSTHRCITRVLPGRSAYGLHSRKHARVGGFELWFKRGVVVHGGSKTPDHGSARTTAPGVVRYVRDGVRHPVRHQTVGAPSCAACAAWFLLSHTRAARGRALRGRGRASHVGTCRTCRTSAPLRHFMPHAMPHTIPHIPHSRAHYEFLYFAFKKRKVEGGLLLTCVPWHGCALR